MNKSRISTISRSWGNMYLAKQGKWPSQHLYLKIKIVGSSQKESQATLSESSHFQWSFIQQKVHLCLWPCSPDNKLNRPSGAWETFIRQKLGLLVSKGHWHIESSHRLRQIDPSGWVGLALWFNITNIKFC